MDQVRPDSSETVLDLGATSDTTYASSNYFEALYPWKDRITASGLDDATFLEQIYTGLRFVRADARNLPFANEEFDIVHSSAVLEHVGSVEQQGRMIAECLRVARRAVCLTTPNRWFPVEFHTQLPFLHWLPKPAFRSLLKAIGLGFFAEEANLNLMTERDLRRHTGCYEGWRFRLYSPRLLGWPSNLVLIGTRIGSSGSSENHLRNR